MIFLIRLSLIVKLLNLINQFPLLLAHSLKNGGEKMKLGIDPYHPSFMNNSIFVFNPSPRAYFTIIKFSLSLP